MVGGAGLAADDGFVGDGFVGVAGEGRASPAFPSRGDAGPAVVDLAVNQELQAEITVADFIPVTVRRGKARGTSGLGKQLNPVAVELSLWTDGETGMKGDRNVIYFDGVAGDLWGEVKVLPVAVEELRKRKISDAVVVEIENDILAGERSVGRGIDDFRFGGLNQADRKSTRLNS